jgi:hypothetical protein
MRGRTKVKIEPIKESIPRASDEGENTRIRLSRGNLRVARESQGLPGVSCRATTLVALSSLT